MSVQDWNTNADLNTNIDGINIAEGWPAANANNAFRAMMANIKVMYNSLPVTADLVAKTGGVFTGNPRFEGRGGYHYNNDAASPGGRWFVQPIGGSVPAGMQNGDFLAEF